MHLAWKRYSLHSGVYFYHDYGLAVATWQQVTSTSMVGAAGA